MNPHNYILIPQQNYFIQAEEDSNYIWLFGFVLYFVFGDVEWEVGDGEWWQVIVFHFAIDVIYSCLEEDVRLITFAYTHLQHFPRKSLGINYEWQCKHRMELGTMETLNSFDNPSRKCFLFMKRHPLFSHFHIFPGTSFISNGNNLNNDLSEKNILLIDILWWMEWRWGKKELFANKQTSKSIFCLSNYSIVCIEPFHWVLIVYNERKFNTLFTWCTSSNQKYTINFCLPDCRSAL